MSTEWQPGDPVYPDERVISRQHCGPCQVSWTADVPRCPECGLGSTEALRNAAADLVRHIRRMLEARPTGPLHDKADRLGNLLEN